MHQWLPMTNYNNTDYLNQTDSLSSVLPSPAILMLLMPR